MIYVAGNSCRKENTRIKVFTTDVVLSKGYDNTPALKYGEKGDSVRFRVGKKLYDSRAEGNTR